MGILLGPGYTSYSYMDALGLVGFWALKPEGPFGYKYYNKLLRFRVYSPLQADRIWPWVHEKRAPYTPYSVTSGGLEGSGRLPATLYHKSLGFRV